MLKLKTKITECDDGYQYIEVKDYKAKHTNTLEHICAIECLIQKIIENDEDMTITKVCKLIKDTYKAMTEAKEEE